MAFKVPHKVRIHFGGGVFVRLITANPDVLSIQLGALWQKVLKLNELIICLTENGPWNSSERSTEALTNERGTITSLAKECNSGNL